MPKVSIEVKKGDGSTYDTTADVTEEAAEEMLKLDSVHRGETKATVTTEPDEDTEDPDAPERAKGALTAEELAERRTVTRGGQRAETTSRKAPEARKKATRKKATRKSTRGKRK